MIDATPTRQDLWINLPDGQRVNIADDELMARVAKVHDIARAPITAADMVAAQEERRLAKAARAPVAFESITDLVNGWDRAKDVFTVERLLRPGYRALLAAYEGVGKTYVAIQAALAFAHPESGALFGEFTVNEPLAVVYVDGEIGTGEFVRRTTALAQELGIKLNGDLFKVVTLDMTEKSLSLRDENDISAIIEACEALHAATGRKVVCILDSTDSLYGKTLWGEDATGYDNAIAAIHEGRRDWLITLTAVHTVKKPRDGRASYRMNLQDVLGNITRQADSVIVLDEKGDFSLRIDVYKRPGRSSGVLQRDDGKSAWRWTVDLDAEDLWPGKTPRTLVIQAMSNGWRGSAADLAGILKVGKSTAERYLDILVQEGTADSEPSGPSSRDPMHYWLRLSDD